MGLTCSLLGHAFDDADVERDRKERGSEVVTTVREIQRCQRCGAERVVSENTEVTAVVEPEGVDQRDEEPTPAGAGGATASGDLPDRDPEDEDAEILTDDRETGQWPDDADASSDADVEPTSEDTGVEIPSEDTGVEPTSDDRVEPTSEDTGVEIPSEDTGVEITSGDTGGETAVDSDPASTDSTGGEEIGCRECGFTVGAGSSYRAGDPCPECGEWLTAERNR